MKKNNSLKLILLALVCNILWGSLFPCIKLGYEAFHIDGSNVPQIMTFAGARFFISGIIIIAFGLLKKEPLPIGKNKGLPAVLLSGLFAIILHYSFTYVGLSMTDSSKTAILKQLATLLYICFGFLIVKEEKFSLGKFLGGLIGFCGIALINTGSGSLQLGLGDWLIIAASICVVVSNLFTKQAMKNATPIMTTGVSHFVGGVVLLVVGLAGGGRIAFTWQSIPIFAYICAASIFAYCLWNYVIKTADLSKMFIIKFAEPLFACLFGWLFLNENIFRWEYLGAFVLICGGILLGNITPKKEKVK